MNSRLTIAAFLTCACGWLSTLSAQPTWPQWRGPDRTDVSQETGLQKTWPDEGPTRLWLNNDAGIGYSGPAVVGDRLFIMGARDQVEYLLAIDVGTGKEIWAARIGDLLNNNWGDGPRGTPTVDGDFVFALGGRGDLVCARVADGEVVWQASMQDFGGKTPNWGYTESVLVDGDQIVCTPGGRQGAILALNKSTGNLAWQSGDFTDGAQYSSLIVAEHNGTRQYIQLTKEHVVGVSAATGDLLWESDWPGRTAVVPTPIFHDGHVYVSSGYSVGCKLLKLGAGNDVEEVYANTLMKNHHGGVLLVGEHLYGYSDGVGWLCQDFKTGERVWNERGELGKGCLTYADGMLYLLDERDGNVVLIEASPDGWNEHGRFLLEPQTKVRSSRGKIWTHPVVVDGRMYLRDQDLLSCFDVKQR